MTINEASLDWNKDTSFFNGSIPFSSMAEEFRWNFNPFVCFYQPFQQAFSKKFEEAFPYSFKQWTKQFASSDFKYDFSKCSYLPKFVPPPQMLLPPGPAYTCKLKSVGQMLTSLGFLATLLGLF